MTRPAPEAPSSEGTAALPVIEDPRAWWPAAGLGLASLLFGIVVLAWPHATVQMLAVMVGLWLLVAGLVRLMTALQPGPGGHELSTALGVVLLIGGVICLRNPHLALALLATIVAIRWLIGGVSDVLLGLRAAGPARLWRFGLGTLSALAGLVVLFWPEPSLAALTFVCGVTGLVLGVAELIWAYRLRRLVKPS